MKSKKKKVVLNKNFKSKSKFVQQHWKRLTFASAPNLVRQFNKPTTAAQTTPASAATDEAHLKTVNAEILSEINRVIRIVNEVIAYLIPHIEFLGYISQLDELKDEKLIHLIISKFELVFDTSFPLLKEILAKGLEPENSKKFAEMLKEIDCFHLRLFSDFQIALTDKFTLLICYLVNLRTSEKFVLNVKKRKKMKEKMFESAQIKNNTGDENFAYSGFDQISECNLSFNEEALQRANKNFKNICTLQQKKITALIKENYALRKENKDINQKLVKETREKEIAMRKVEVFQEQTRNLREQLQKCKCSTETASGTEGETLNKEKENQARNDLRKRLAEEISAKIPAGKKHKVEPRNASASSVDLAAIRSEIPQDEVEQQTNHENFGVVVETGSRKLLNKTILSPIKQEPQENLNAPLVKPMPIITTLTQELEKKLKKEVEVKKEIEVKKEVSG